MFGLLQKTKINEININNIDLIIDGPYVEQKGTVNSPTTNQQCYVNKNGTWSIVKFNDLKDIKWRK